MQVLSHLTWALPSSPRELLPGVFVLWVKLLSTASVITQGCVLGNWDSKKTFLCRWSFSLMRHTVLWVCFPLLLLRPMSAVFKCSWQQTNHELKMCGNVVCHEDQSVEESIYIWVTAALCFGQDIPNQFYRDPGSLHEILRSVASELLLVSFNSLQNCGLTLITFCCSAMQEFCSQE